MRQYMIGKKSGSAMLAVVFLGPVAAALIFSLINLAIVSKTQTVVNQNMVNFSILMDGAIEYTTYAMKSKWCMNSNWTQDTVNTCDLKHPMNFERLMLDNLAVQAIRDYNQGVAGFSSTTLMLKEFETTLNLQSLPAGHPLEDLIKNFRGKALNSISNMKIHVRRLDNAKIPQRGRESNIEITVTLESTTPVFRNLSQVTSRSRVIVAPRELNYFTMVVPNDLYLNGGNAIKPGDISLPKMSSGFSGAGVIFDSPVFVNGDLYIPRQEDTSGYVPATFSQRVVMGGADLGGSGGRVMVGTNTPYGPLSYGGKDEDIYYSMMKNFGGFKKGIEFDGKRDMGLLSLVGLDPDGGRSTIVNEAQMDQCLMLNAIKSDLSLTKDSSLAIKYLNDPNVDSTCITPAGVPGTCTEWNKVPVGKKGKLVWAASYPGAINAKTLAQSKHVFALALTDKNFFYPQDVKVSRQESPAPSWNGGMTAAPASEKSIVFMSVKFKRGTDTVTGNFTLDRGTVLSANIGADSSLMAPKTERLAPSLTIRLEDFSDAVVDGYAGINFAKLTVEARGRLSIPEQISIDIKAFDVAHWAGRDRREYADEAKATNTRTAHLEFSTVNGKLVLVNSAPINSTTWVKADPSSTGAIAAGAIDMSYSIAKNLDLCAINLVPSADLPGPSFGSVDWSTGQTFTKQTRFAWNFAPTRSNVPNNPAFKPYNTIPAGNLPYVIEQPSATSAVNFPVVSIASKCTVPSSVDYFVGFYTCDEFIVNARSKPLEFIGTIIAGKMTVDPSVIQNGWKLRSIYHPQATQKLISWDVLRNQAGSNCSQAFGVGGNLPIWWPNRSAADYAEFRKCNTVSLRDSANPLTWTQVDPDCGVPDGKVSVQCKRRAEKYIIREITRDSDLQ